MNIVSIIFTAIALAMDAFAVSITKGMTLKSLSKGIAIKIALFFGVFQAAMPLIGWILGIGFQDHIKAIDHWVALILLSILGGKMIYEFYKGRKEEKDEVNDAEIEVSTTLESDKDELSKNAKLIPTAKASILVAIARTIIVLKSTLSLHSSSSSFDKASFIILIPIKTKSPKAIQ